MLIWDTNSKVCKMPVCKAYHRAQDYLIKKSNNNINQQSTTRPIIIHELYKQLAFLAGCCIAEKKVLQQRREMLEDLELTCLKDWLVSRSCPGCRRAQRDTNTLKTHAKISTSSRKQWWLEQRTTAMHTPRWSWEAIINYCTVQVIRGSWNLHILHLHYLWAAGVKTLLLSNLVPVFVCF